MSVTLGEVKGDVCPHCKEELNLEGEFYEGSEVECESCGALLCVGKVEAVYTVRMDLLCEPPPKEEASP